MYVRRLQLQNFRNYQELDLALEPGRLLFIGDNAQGKSNLLEAVYLLASGRSVRASADNEMIGWRQSPEGQPFARLTGSVQRREDSLSLEAVIVGQAVGAGPRAGKRLRVNGIARRSIDFVGQLRAALFTADDLEIVSGPPAGRRQYLDVALSQRDRAYRGALQRYARILQQRNASLRRIREGVAGPEELSLWDEGFAREASVIVWSRREAVKRLAGWAAAAHLELSGEAREELAIEYQPQLGEEWSGMLPPKGGLELVRQVLSAALTAQRRREMAAGVSLVGPHRDELAVRLNGVSAASFGSRAQIRTAALSLRLAEARMLQADVDDAPVVLLDDIFSELDERRRTAVLEGLAGFDQLWLTATTGARLPDAFTAGSRTFQVRAGSVHAA